MSESVVARLRERIRVANGYHWTGIGIEMAEIETLLDVVERFAAVEPVDDHIMVHEDRCLYCNALVEMEGDKHAPDCPWLLARKACGLDGDA